MDENEIRKIAVTDPDLAFEKLFELYSNRIFYFCLHITGDREDSLEIVQDVFLKAYFQKNLFEEGFNIRAWLYKVSRNDCRKFFRIIRKTLSVLDFSKKELSEPVSEDITDYEEFNRKLDNIPEKHRTVLFLRFYENLSYEEISDILEVPVGTVMSRISRAKEVFRRAYEETK